MRKKKKKSVKVTNKGKTEDTDKSHTLHYMDDQSLNVLTESRVRSELGKNKAGVSLDIRVYVRKG